MKYLFTLASVTMMAAAQIPHFLVPHPELTGDEKLCGDRVDKLFWGDVCGGTVYAPGCASNECCKSAGLGHHCFCDTCD